MIPAAAANRELIGVAPDSGRRLGRVTAMTEQLPARLDTTVHPDRAATIRAGLRAYNVRHSAVLRRMADLPDTGEEPVQVCALIGDTVAGGLVGRTWAGWLHIDLLWLPEDQRGTGLGTRLLHTAEELARARGCTDSRTETWDFQAPEFYRRNGYRVVAEIPGYPADCIEYILTKELS